MTALAGADTESLVLLGARLTAVAGALTEVEDATRRAGRAAWRWRGPAAQHFDTALTATERHSVRVRPPYEQVGGAVRSYALAVEQAAAAVRRAAAMRADADVLSARAPAIGPDPGEALRWAATHLERQATAAHEEAAARAAAQVRAAQESLPRAARGTGWSRFTTDLAGGVLQQAVGLAGFGVVAARAVGGDRGARAEVWSAARGAWRVWEPAVQVWHDVRDGRYGLAASGALGMAVGRIRPRLVTDLEVAHGEALQAARWAALTDRLGVREEHLTHGSLRASLFAQEALGGHAVREHVAKSDAYLRWRSQSYAVVSTFPDARTAQRSLDGPARP